MKPIILLSAQFDSTKRGVHPNIATYYVECVAAAGGIPYIASSAGEDLQATAADGLLLTGGGDIAPKLYGEVQSGGPFFPEPERDLQDIALFHAFYKMGKPILGICRGAQVINVALGGTLCQDLPSELGVNHDLSADGSHVIHISKDSVLYELFGDTVITNSSHHQAVKAPGRGLMVTARSVDGVSEAVEHTGAPVWGVQWHPEHMARPGAGDNSGMAAIFNRFIRQCEERRNVGV